MQLTNNVTAYRHNTVSSMMSTKLSNIFWREGEVFTSLSCATPPFIVILANFSFVFTFTFIFICMLVDFFMKTIYKLRSY